MNLPLENDLRCAVQRRSQTNSLAKGDMALVPPRDRSLGISQSTDRGYNDSRSEVGTLTPSILSAVEFASEPTPNGELSLEARRYEANEAVNFGIASEDFPEALVLESSTVLIVDQRQWKPLYARQVHCKRSIASLTKLMTAMVVLDLGVTLDEWIQIALRDVDWLKRSSSRLKVGTKLKRYEMLRLALMASENRAAAALARTYPGGTKAFIKAMNDKAAKLQMLNTKFVDPTGLNPGNVSTAYDLAIMVNAAYDYALLRQFTTGQSQDIAYKHRRAGRLVSFHNTNRLVYDNEWEIGISKTGYIREAGRCLVMQTVVANRPVIIVLLNSIKKQSRLADAEQVKRWLTNLKITKADSPRNQYGGFWPSADTIN
ncbi:MAG: peptidase S11 [Betaproteobacteria bacterium]